MTAPRVLLPHQVDPETTAEFRDAVGDRIPGEAILTASTPEETREHLPEAEAVVSFRFPREYWSDAPQLRWIQALSAGVDHFDHDALREADVALTNASGVHAEPIAEQVLGYALAFERELHESIRRQERRTWERPTGATELRGKTVGILGVGAIGSRVAELAAAFDTTVLGTKRDTSSVPDAVDEIFPAENYWPVLERSDYLVLACPLTEQTRGLVGADELRVLPSDAVVINIARGEVVDQDALVGILQNNGIGGAALDVFDEEPLPRESALWDLSNVIVTPHMAGSTPEYLRRCGDIFVENYEHFRAGDLEAMRNRIL